MRFLRVGEGQQPDLRDMRAWQAILQQRRNRIAVGQTAIGVAEIEVRVDPLASATEFRLPRRAGSGPVAVLARSLAAGSRTRYEAATRLVGWVSTNVRYVLDRSAPQEAEAVLARRTAYCTGFARHSVALLAAVGIPAREVAGYVTEDLPSGPRSGFHRWIEIWFPDRGWVFSDPLASLHFVAANHLRLADEDLTTATPGPALLLERRDRLRPSDVFPDLGGATLAVRGNGGGRAAAALYVEVKTGGTAEAVLEGSGLKRSLRLVDGRGTFLGLEPGRYRLALRGANGYEVLRDLTFRSRVRGEMIFDGWSGSGAPGR